MVKKIIVAGLICGIGLTNLAQDQRPGSGVISGRPVDPVIQANKDYLAENAKRKGVMVTESGLQIEMLVEGYGRQPTINDTVMVDYQGWMIDGTLFDSSIKRGKPARFRLNGVVQGFREGLMNIRVGGKARLFLPSHLGYGTRGSGKDIPPNSVLIFEVELLDVL